MNNRKLLKLKTVKKDNIETYADNEIFSIITEHEVSKKLTK